MSRGWNSLRPIARAQWRAVGDRRGIGPCDRRRGRRNVDQGCRCRARVVNGIRRRESDGKSLGITGAKNGAGGGHVNERAGDGAGCIQLSGAESRSVYDGGGIGPGDRWHDGREVDVDCRRRHCGGVIASIRRREDNGKCLAGAGA